MTIQIPSNAFGVLGSIHANSEPRILNREFELFMRIPNREFGHGHGTLLSLHGRVVFGWAVDARCSAPVRTCFLGCCAVCASGVSFCGSVEL